MATATATRTDRSFEAIFWAVTLAPIAPIFSTRFLPFGDLPEHVAAIATLSRIFFPTGTHEPYTVALGSSQYLLYHSVGALLTAVVKDAIVANQLLLSAIAVFWTLGMRAVLRAADKDERLALAAPLVFFNRALSMGFLPFVAAVPLALFAFAELYRKPYPRPFRLGVLAVLLFTTHVSIYLLVVATAVAVVMVRGRAVAIRAVALVPSGTLALLWWSEGSLGTGRPLQDDVGRMGLGRTLRALFVWAFDIWQSHFDELCAAMFWAAFAVLLVSGLNRKRIFDRRDLLPLVPFVCAFALYVATPFRVGFASMLNVRLAPVVVLLSVLALPRFPRSRVTTVAVWAIGAASILCCATSASESRRSSRELMGDFGALLDRMHVGARLVTLTFEQHAASSHFWPYLFAGSYTRARWPGSVAGWSFSELPHWSVHYASGEAPPRRHPFWSFRPCPYRFVEDGNFYDYVLVQGDADPFAGQAGPPFVLAAESGVFRLFEKAVGPPAPAEGGDYGPCKK